MANETAFSDKGTILYHKSDNSYSKLVGIVDTSDTGGEPAQIEVTELDSEKKQYVSDRQDSPNQNFTYNRTAEKFSAVSGICDGNEHEFVVKYSDGTGTYIKGIPTTWKKGYSRGSAQEAILCIVPSEITDKTAQEVSALIPASGVSG